MNLAYMVKRVSMKRSSGILLNYLSTCRAGVRNFKNSICVAAFPRFLPAAVSPSVFMADVISLIVSHYNFLP